MSKRGQSAQNLENLYIVVIGVSLAQGAAALIGAEGGLSSISPESGLYFLAYLATLVPFFHGALLYFDVTYVQAKEIKKKSGALIVDFFFFFLHALGFVGLSLLLTAPMDFVYVLIGILVVDIGWGGFAAYSTPEDASQSPDHGSPGKWALINIGAVIALGGILFLSKYLITDESTLPFSYFILAVTVIRSFVDYLWCRDFYFKSVS